VRTIYLDIRALEDARVPICAADGRLSLAVMFTENEANALILAEQLV